MASEAQPLQQHPATSEPPCATVPPALTMPLVSEPAQSCPGPQLGTRGPLEWLLGTWTNQDLIPGSGGPENPYSYNLMVLPQTDPSTPEGYILKNMSYYEEITFSPIHGNAANRGGLGVQVSNTLFYEQRIFISQISGTPAGDQLVHAENGSWLFLSDDVQYVGPYGSAQSGAPTVQNSVAPTQPFNIVKQIAVPHGNSVLALGQLDWPSAPIQGQPNIQPCPQIFPFDTRVGTGAYNDKSQGNPNVPYTLNPNQALVDALNTPGLASVSQYFEIQVDTANGAGQVTNIGFEQQHADVVNYSATYWLEDFGANTFPLLQYSQTIMLRIPIPGKGYVIFPHITTNTLTLVPGSRPSPPSEAAQAATELQA